MNTAYAVCDDCGSAFNNRAEMNTHLNETFDASPEGNSHTVSVINPYPQEQRQNRATRLIDRAIYEAIDYIDRNRGDLSDEEIDHAMSLSADLRARWHAEKE